MKRRTLAQLRVHPDSSAMALDDLFAHREAKEELIFLPDG